jgi:hypothetical protein
MNYQMIAVMLLSAIVTLGIIGLLTPMLYESIPSEEKCQSVYGYGQQEKAYAEKMFCEFNETGWHFNKTKYKEAWNKVENYVV